MKSYIYYFLGGMICLGVNVGISYVAAYYHKSLLVWNVFLLFFGLIILLSTRQIQRAASDYAGIASSALFVVKMFMALGLFVYLYQQFGMSKLLIIHAMCVYLIYNVILLIALQNMLNLKYDKKH